MLERLLSRRRASAAIALCLIAAAGVGSLVVGPRTDARDEASSSKEPNSRLVTDRNGQRMMVERWPMGRIENVMHLRIPLGYNSGPLSSAIAASPAFSRDANVVGSYTQTIILQALLPDFQPKTSENATRFNETVSDEVVGIHLSTNVRSKHRGIAIVDVTFRDRLPMVLNAGAQKYYNLTFERKPSRFGLERMGPVGQFERFRKFGNVSDILYPAYDPKDVYIICAAEEIRDVTEDPTWNLRPFCEHFFYTPTLDALVKLFYRRVHLSEWPSLQGRAEALFKTFEILPVPRRD